MVQIELLPIVNDIESGVTCGGSAMKVQGSYKLMRQGTGLQEKEEDLRSKQWWKKSYK